MQPVLNMRGGVYRVAPPLRYHGGFVGGGCQRLVGLLHQCCRQRIADGILRLGTRDGGGTPSWVVKATLGVCHRA